MGMFLLSLSARPCRLELASSASLQLRLCQLRPTQQPRLITNYWRRPEPTALPSPRGRTRRESHGLVDVLLDDEEDARRRLGGAVLDADNDARTSGDISIGVSDVRFRWRMISSATKLSCNLSHISCATAAAIFASATRFSSSVIGMPRRGIGGRGRPSMVRYCRQGSFAAGGVVVTAATAGFPALALALSAATAS